MRKDMGVPAAPSGHSAKPEPVVPALRASVPNAETLIRLMSAWNSLPGSKFHKAYPFFRPHVREIASEYGLADAKPGGMSYGTAVAILFAEYADELYAQGTEAGTAETLKDCSVHDGPVTK